MIKLNADTNFRINTLWSYLSAKHFKRTPLKKKKKKKNHQKAQHIKMCPKAYKK